jgi:hypothetical protein
MSLKPGFYRFFVPDHILESHPHALLGFLAAAGLLPVRIDPDYCQQGKNYVVQYGADRPIDREIRDANAVWHSAECRFSLALKPAARDITPDEQAVINVARRVAHDASANLRTVAQNVDDLVRAVRKLPDVSPPIVG